MTTLLTTLEPSTSLNVPECLASADRLNAAAPPNSLLSERQQAAIELLLLGKGVTSTARAVEVDRRTVHRWMHDDDFREELDRRRRELWREAGAATRAGGEAAS